MKCNHFYRVGNQQISCWLMCCCIAQDTYSQRCVCSGGAGAEGLRGQRRLGDLPLLRGSGAGHSHWPAASAPLLPAVLPPGAERERVHRPRAARVWQRRPCQQPRPQQVSASGGYTHTHTLALHINKAHTTLWFPHPVWITPLTLKNDRFEKVNLFIGSLLSCLIRVLVWCWWRRRRELPEMNTAPANWLLSQVRFGTAQEGFIYPLLRHPNTNIYIFKAYHDWNVVSDVCSCHQQAQLNVLHVKTFPLYIRRNRIILDICSSVN